MVGGVGGAAVVVPGVVVGAAVPVRGRQRARALAGAFGGATFATDGALGLVSGVTTGGGVG